MIFLLLAFLSLVDGTPKCISESGASVDWFFIYKQPNGLTYAYTDSQSSSTTLKLANGNLDSSSTSLVQTLAQVYTAKSSLAYLAWNDEVPTGVNDNADSLDPLNTSSLSQGLMSDKTSNTPSSSRNMSVNAMGGPANDDAHAKGILATDGSKGFWLIHSVPKFPDLSQKTFSWTASTTYGQSMLCISVSASTVEDIAAVLLYANLGIYSSNLPSSLRSSLPNMADLIDDKDSDGSTSKVIESVGGQRFTIFSKSESWGQDLYEKLVSPTLKVSFFWETWRRTPQLPSYCKGSQYAWDELNVQEIDFTAGGGTKFSYTKDHAKWGISETSSSPWVCVGDINRMTSQRERGGGTACFEHRALYDGLNAVISKHDACDSAAIVEIA